MGVVAEVSDKVIVMYCGRILEYADVRSLFNKPKHPYTLGLLKSIPKIEETKSKLYTIRGSVPAPGQITEGCRFKTRCDFVMDVCLKNEPPFFKSDKNLVRCWKYE